MSGEPIHSRCRPHVGDPAIPSIEYEVLSRKHRKRETRLTTSIWIGFFVFFAALGAMALDSAIWMAGGSLPYMQRATDGVVWHVGLATGIGFAVLILLLGRPKLLPLVLVPAIAAGALLSGYHYHKAIAAKGHIETEAFYIYSLDLYSGRRIWRTRRYQAVATLVDRRGNHWPLHGRFEYIQQLAGQDCVTIAFRQAGRYRFPVSLLAVAETPYLDSIRKKRHPERCFASPIPK